MKNAIVLLICCIVISISGCNQTVKLSCDVGECRVLPKLPAKKASDGWAYQEGLLRPEWSPDGKCIIFARLIVDKDLNGIHDIWVLSSDGSGPKKLTDGIKGSWQSPDVIAYTYWTEKNEKLTAHNALINVRTAEITPLKNKPAPPKKVQFKWNGKTYSIFDSARPSRYLQEAFDKEFERTGYHVCSLNVCQGIMYFCRAGRTVDTPITTEICQLVSDDIRQAKVIVNNACSPSLSYDGKKMLFNRDGDLWIKSLANNSEDTLSPQHH